jgi:ribonuclease J
MGYSPQEVIIPEHGQVVELANRQFNFGETVYLKELMVDGKGVGDVGTVVLSDRKMMAQDGMIVLVVPKHGQDYDLSNIQVISRGFIYMKNAEQFVQEIRLRTAEILSELIEQGEKEAEIRRAMEKRLSRRLDKMIGRTPLIITVFMEL